MERPTREQVDHVLESIDEFDARLCGDEQDRLTTYAVLLVREVRALREELQRWQEKCWSLEEDMACRSEMAATINALREEVKCREVERDGANERARMILESKDEVIAKLREDAVAEASHRAWCESTLKEQYERLRVAAADFVENREEATENIWYCDGKRGRKLLDVLGIPYVEKE